MPIASQVAYWVGQANDLSGGSHPSGWVSGQRWSTTATQWNTMYNTEYANARDTSGGTHPPGWGSGQLWSTTASQWKGQADYYYGPNRVWNSGSTWEALSKDTQGTVNGYATPGWSNGQYWSTSASQWQQQWLSDYSARYTAGYNAGYAQATSDKQPAALWQGDLAAGTQYAPYNGYYVARCKVNYGEYNGSPSFYDDADTSQWWVQLNVNGGQAARSQHIGGGGFHNMGGNELHAGFSATYYPAGTSFSMTRGTHTDAPSGYVTFVPTPAYPH